MGYILIWLFFGIFTALIASSRNRSVFGWFFIGFLFGPFGLLFALFMKDGKDLENEEEKRKIAQKINDKILSEDTYEYKIKPNKATIEDDWDKVKKAIFNLLDENYKVKQNDMDAVRMEVSQSAYIKMYKIKEVDERGSLELLFKVNSVKCGKINFGDDIEVVSVEKEEKDMEEDISNTSNMDSSEKLIKLAEMLEKGLITDEEFKKQKETIL